MTDQTPADRALAEAAAAEAMAAAQSILGEASEPATLLPAAAGNAGGLAAPPESVKRTLQARRAESARAAADLERARTDLQSSMKAGLDAMKEAMRSRLAEMEEVLGPLQEQLSRLEEGIWTVNLYLGRDERIVTLADGEPAPAETPLTLRQMVLYMDEESVALATDGGLDFKNIDLFDRWLTEGLNNGDTTHLDQVAPEARCVVVLKPRRTKFDYGDALLNQILNEEDQRTYWLLRNGTKVFRMTTSLDVGDHLMPTRDEFTSLFRLRRRNWDTGEYEYEDLLPGTDAWLRAEKAQGARTRHFMRVGLVISGILERTPVFHPLPHGRPFSVLHPEAYEAGLVRVVGDDEAAIGTGRTPFYEWLKELNDQLRPGMRIIGAFDSSAWRDMRGSERRYDEHSRLNPRHASSPRTAAIYRIERRERGLDGRGFVFLYERAGQQWLKTGPWDDYELRTPKRRASCFIRPDDRFILPFDLVTVEEMEGYLNARSDRHAYLEMIPLLRAAIAAKREEEAAEAPFRTLLVGEVMRGHDVALDEAETAVPDLVDWWKLKNRWHRPLVTGQGDDHLDPAAEAKAVRMIVDEFGRRKRAAAGADAAMDEAAVRRLLDHDPTIMFIGRTRAGRYLAFAPMPMAYDPPAAAPNVWVRELATGRTERSTITEKEWVLPGTRAIHTTTVHQTEAWTGWDTAAAVTEHLTDPEIAELVAAAEEAAGAPEIAEQLGSLIGVTHDRSNRTFEVWGYDLPDEASLVPSTRFRTSHGTHGVRFTWSRQDGTPRLHLHDRHYVYDHQWHTRDHYPWGSVWDGRSRDPAPVLLHVEVLTRAQEARATMARVDQVSDGLRAAVRSALDRVEQAWMARAEVQAYDRFIDDYADPALWEGHRKTLNIRFPHRDALYGRWSPCPIKEAFSTLVDHGVPIRGAVVEILAVAEALNGGPSDTGAPVPEGLLDLSITDEPDPDDAEDTI